MTNQMTHQNPQETTATEAQRQRYLKPLYDVTGDKESYQVRVYMPGVSKDGVNITLEKGDLLIEGSRSSYTQPGWRPVHREIPEADFRLRLQLNINVDEGKIKAKTQDGILQVILPVAEEAKPRSIAVS